MSRTLLLVLGLSLLGGCFSKADDDDDDDDGGSSASVTQAEFASGAAAAMCATWAECDPTILEYFGGDEAGCIAELEDAYRDIVDGPQCDYDGEEAAECLGLIEGITCADLSDTGEETEETACQRMCGEEDPADTGW